ncbi:hypothetical protein HMPREF1370_03045 [Enterococcus faecium P1123]|nr:hypothetical protein HMPREF1374_01873 [Enterococcus faecium P1190]EJX69670.1 hypothetical protein HMPREF1372_03232 [Enterococcus faecium P1139]EJX75492.1 hypothetical protein HMPREF1370_03045 [Enterococcus faecium P1123]
MGLYEELIKKPNKIEGQAANIKRIINANKNQLSTLPNWL